MAKIMLVPNGKKVKRLYIKMIKHEFESKRNMWEVHFYMSDSKCPWEIFYDERDFEKMYMEIGRFVFENFLRHKGIEETFDY